MIFKHSDVIQIGLSEFKQKSTDVWLLLIEIQWQFD